VRVPTQDFSTLISAIADAHARLSDRAARAVNTALTLRNWIIGAYIHNYELDGQDRAAYGEQLLERLAERLGAIGVPRTDARELRRYRLFYQTYPRIWESLTPELGDSFSWMTNDETWESSTPVLQPSGTALLQHLSYTHIVELLGVDSPTKRNFYETQAISGQWSVRELRRQISSLLFERTALSRDPGRSLLPSSDGMISSSMVDIIRDPYVFEFLGFKSQETMAETRLEGALLDKVQAFLLELGRGFCFEAKQKRINIGGELYFVDLVFYHRLLKCHVLIELKVDEFRHEHLGQLNTYVNWYRKHEMAEGDNPPVGLLLCTRKNHALVEYALAGMDNQLFVSKYLLALPGKEEVQRFVEAELTSVAEDSELGAQCEGK
jgi:predicted nuclease of restriction endonuclease-like (RecB) superfamily